MKYKPATSLPLARHGVSRDGRWGWRKPRMVNGRLLLWTGQMESLSGLVLMVLQSDSKEYRLTDILFWDVSRP